MTTQEREYVLGTHDAELNRLGLQHRLWADTAHAQWRHAGFGPGHTILDVGCGPGFATRDLAQLVGPAGGGGQVIAIDESRRYVEFVRATPAPPGAAPIDAREGDVQHLDLPPASLDGAYARWVLSFTPDPERVIAGIAAALRPGAALAVHDYSHWMGLHWGPRNDTLELLRRGILAAYSASHADSSIGAKAPAMMARHGLDPVEISPLSRIARPDQPMWHWPRTFLTTFLPKIVEAGFLPEADRLAIEAEWDANENDPGAFFFTPPQVEIIARKR
jgi:SAM-dependent methyltransferase